MTRREAVIEQLEGMGFLRNRDDDWTRAFEGDLAHDLRVHVRVGPRGALLVRNRDGGWTRGGNANWIWNIIEAGEHCGRWLV